MRISNRLARLLREKRPAVGLGNELADPAVAQIAVLAGYDWLLIDMEHNPFTESQVLAQILAVDGYDLTPVVRVRANRQEHVKWVLDAGAGGLIIPGIVDADDARHAVRICKYHPLGARGYAPGRVSGFMSQVAEYIARANRDIVLICQVELASAVEDVERICQVEGIDGLWIGPADLAQSLGHIGRPDHPDVQAAIGRVIETAGHYGRPWGLPVRGVEDFERYVKQGGTVMLVGLDSRLIKDAAVQLAAKGRALLQREGLREA